MYKHFDIFYRSFITVELYVVFTAPSGSAENEAATIIV